MKAKQITTYHVKGEAKTWEKALDLKVNSPEVKMIPRIGVLDEYLEASIVEVRALVERYPKEVSRDWEELNRLFLAALEMFG